MQFLINVTEIFGFHLKSQTVLICGANYSGPHLTHFRNPSMFKDRKLAQGLIDHLGKRSAFKRNFKQTTTDCQRFCKSSDRIYLFVFKNKVIEFLRVGQRQVQYSTGKQVSKISITCLLDTWLESQDSFNSIFVHFLQTQKLFPHQVAYDNPTSKLLQFLSCYKLTNFLPQNSKIVIFKQFFQQKQVSLVNQKKHQKTIEKNNQITFEVDRKECNHYTQQLKNIYKQNQQTRLHLKRKQDAQKNGDILKFGYELKQDYVDLKALREEQDQLSFKMREMKTQSQIERLRQQIEDTERDIPKNLDLMYVKESTTKSFFKRR